MSLDRLGGGGNVITDHAMIGYVMTTYIHERMREQYPQDQTSKEELIDMLQQLLHKELTLEINAKPERVSNDINNKHEEVCALMEMHETKIAQAAEVTSTIDYNKETDKIAKLVFSNKSEYEDWVASVLTQEQTQSQLEGTCDSTLEIDDFEEISLPCAEKVFSSNLLLIDECLDLS